MNRKHFTAEAQRRKGIAKEALSLCGHFSAPLRFRGEDFFGWSDAT